jgi:hypothetical protein
MGRPSRVPVDFDAPELVAALNAKGLTPAQQGRLIGEALARQGADWDDMEAQAEAENALRLEEHPLVLFAHHGFEEWLAQRES